MLEHKSRPCWRLGTDSQTSSSGERTLGQSPDRIQELRVPLHEPGVACGFRSTKDRAMSIPGINLFEICCVAQHQVGRSF